MLDWSVQAVVERRPRDLQRKLSKVAYNREHQARVRALHNAALMLETKAKAEKRFKAGMLSFTYLYGLALHCSGKGQLAIAHPGFMLDWYGRPRRGNIYNMTGGPLAPAALRTAVQLRLGMAAGCDRAGSPKLWGRPCRVTR